MEWKKTSEHEVGTPSDDLKSATVPKKVAEKLNCFTTASFPCWPGGFYSLVGLVAFIPLLALWRYFLAGASHSLAGLGLFLPCWLGGSYSLAGLVVLFPCLPVGSYSHAGGCHSHANSSKHRSQNTIIFEIAKNEARAEKIAPTIGKGMEQGQTGPRFETPQSA